MPYVEYDEVQAICPDCGRTFRSEEALGIHREESHSGLEPSRSATASLEGRTCRDCRRSFPTDQALRAHVAGAHSQP
ncbi:MAG: C2H2-type zinc finger protein [Thermoplasmata archaeon]